MLLYLTVCLRIQDIPETAETAGERELTTPSVEAQAVDADAVLGGGDDKGIGAGGAAGIAIALALCLLACVIGAVLCIRRKRNREREDEDTWKWYLYRGGDDEGASTRTVRSIPVFLHWFIAF